MCLQKTHFDYDALIKISDQKENTSVFQVCYLIFIQEKTKSFSINQNLNYYYTLSDKHVLVLKCNTYIKMKIHFIMLI